MLHPNIKAKFEALISRIKKASYEVHESGLEKPFHVANAVAIIDQSEFKTSPLIESEIFGPYATVVMYDDTRIIEEYLRECAGQLTCSVFSNTEGITANQHIINLAINQVGRMIINDVPTGVVVSKAMQHGGPYPASSDSRFTAVGSLSIFRFVRDVTIQKNII
jgi:NADP-dependent aldehyde dehydrogenase